MARKSKWLNVSKQFFLRNQPKYKTQTNQLSHSVAVFSYLSRFFSPRKRKKKQVKEKPIFLKNSLYNSCSNQTKYSKQSKTNKQTNQVTRQLQTK